MTTTFDFGYGPVPAQQHFSGGGWVADTATVAATAYVGPNAEVSGNATVYGNAEVYGNAKVYDNAEVYDNAIVYGNAEVYGNARVFGDAMVFGNAKVYGNARVFGDAEVFGNAKIEFSTHVKMINRSDNYTFTLFRCDDSVWRLIAGCRYFTMEEAEKHWLATRAGTLLGDETMDILDLFKKHIARYS